MIRRMLREEWRMHSRMYRGRSFATFPLVIFTLSLGFTFATTRYSTLDAVTLGTGLKGLAAFLGLAVGSIGFSSRDAMKNVLGPTNFLVYSSRTLPLSERKLLLDFIVKDIIYYMGLFILPVSAGFLVAGGFRLLGDVLLMPAWFVLALGASILAARSSMRLPVKSIVSYSRLSGLSPVSRKSVLDVSRSSGGMIKIVFSLAVLTGFYWFVVLYFPVAQYFLQNPLLSFSTVIGMLNLSVYNWINRFDSLEDYLYLPLDREGLLEAKKQAYICVAVPLSVALVLLSSAVYPSKILLPLATAVITTLYTLSIACHLTGLNPNRKLFSSKVFLKYLAANSLVVVPLLVISVVYTSAFFVPYTAVLFAAVAMSAIEIV